jgi:predicted transcriptional regulator
MTQARISIKDDRKKRWFWIDNQVFNGHAAKMKPSGIAVYCVLLRHTDNVTAQTWPSIRTIADELGLSTTTVNEALNRLEDLQLIQVERPGAPKGNIYTVLEPPHVLEFDVSENDTCVAENDTYVANFTTHVSKTDTELNTTTKHNSKHNNKRNVVALSSLSPEQTISYNTLIEAGVTKETSRHIAEEIEPPRISQVCLAARLKEGITDKPAWIVAALKEGWEVNAVSEKKSAIDPFAGTREL